MNVSESWLRTWIDLSVNQKDLLHRLTMAGLEVEQTERCAPPFQQVVVSEIISCQPHENADKLKVVQVAIEPHKIVQIVCGAPNVRVGLKVPCAKVNALLPNDFHIKEAKIRGVSSHGMLCSANELGLSGFDSTGIMELPADAPVGEDIRKYLDLDDITIKINLTPNRGDCLSVRGLAREVSAIYQCPLKEVTDPSFPIELDTTFPVDVQEVQACPCFLGRVFTGISKKAVTPLWMVQRLIRSGISPLSPIVDITNYVMLEFGQPLHGYDLDQLDTSIIVRYAKKNEKIALLNGIEYDLTEDTLVIADRKKALGIAGIMGGQESRIVDTTDRVFLEAAFFDPLKIAGKARFYGLSTEASHRFERGVDFHLPYRAMQRATALILNICGGKAGPLVEKVSEKVLPQCLQIKLHKKNIQSLLGISVENSFVQKTLTSLGFEWQPMNEETFIVKTASWRFDVKSEVDLIEEIARLYGYDNIPEMELPSIKGHRLFLQKNVSIDRIKTDLVSRGYNETVNFSLINPQWQQVFDSQAIPVLVKNPISVDMSIMRTSLLPGLLNTLGYNQKRQEETIRLFEEGQCFLQNDQELLQNNYLAALISGSAFPENWANNHRPCDFYDIKGDLEALLDITCSHVCFKKGHHPAMHPEQSAVILQGKKQVGYIGALHPRFLKELGVKGNVYAFEILTEALHQHGHQNITPLSKYPKVRRDLAMVISEDILYDDVLAVVKKAAGDLLIDVILFDIYAGSGIEKGYKSFALGLIWQHPLRTLKDEEINEVFRCIVDSLKTQFNATLR